MKSIDSGRRRLLGLGRPHPSQRNIPQAIANPAIDPALCNACDACVRVCSPGALRREHTEACYVIDAARCTDCGLCIDVCDRAAVRLERGGAPAMPMRLALYRVRCPVCGSDCLSTQPEPSANCRFCSRPATARGALRLQE